MDAWVPGLEEELAFWRDGVDQFVAEFTKFNQKRAEAFISPHWETLENSSESLTKRLRCVLNENLCTK